MFDILEEMGKLSFFGIFILLVTINAMPILMPPSWIVLSSFYATDQNINNIFVLVLVGATGSLIGRIILFQISSYFRIFLGKERTSNLDNLHEFFKVKKYGYFFASFLYALSPLPSNIMFITYGIMKSHSLGIFLGFWAGRVISYYVLISTSSIVLKPLMEIFSSRLLEILVIDIAGILSIVVFTSINWMKLIKERKFEFVRPKLWRF